MPFTTGGGGKKRKHDERGQRESLSSFHVWGKNARGLCCPLELGFLFLLTRLSHCLAEGSFLAIRNPESALKPYVGKVGASHLEV